MDWRDIGVGWGIFAWWTASVASVSGFLWRINGKVNSNCKAVRELRKRLSPDDPRLMMVTVGQCGEIRSQCRIDRKELVSEIKDEIIRNNQDMDHHLEGIYNEMKNINSILTTVRTQLEERTSR